MGFVYGQFTQVTFYCSFIHSYSFINVACQNARTYITYSDIHELYELKKLIVLCTLRIVNILVNLTIKRDKVSKVIYLTGKSSNVTKTTVKN